MKPTYLRRLCVCVLGSATAMAFAESFEQRNAALIQGAWKTATPANSNAWLAESYFQAGRNTEAKALMKNLVQNTLMKGRSYFRSWEALDAYIPWQDSLDSTTRALFKTYYTTLCPYHGSTSNLSFLSHSNYYLAAQTWGDSSFAKSDSLRPKSMEAAKQWILSRYQSQLYKGMAEFASRPYGAYNLGGALSLAFAAKDTELVRKSLFMYEVGLAQAAPTWLRGHWGVVSQRSYPDLLRQAPSSFGMLLWQYFGGKTPQLYPLNQGMLAAVHPQYDIPDLIRLAATDRSKAFAARSNFGGRDYQYSWLNKRYVLFSAGNDSGVLVGQAQTYPFGVLFEETTDSTNSSLWLTVPRCDSLRCENENNLSEHTHGIDNYAALFLQHEGTMLIVHRRRPNPPADWYNYNYILGFVPGGYASLINESSTSGRIFLHYRNVMVAITASSPFPYTPGSGMAQRFGQRLYPGDAEFRVHGDFNAAALETALPEDYPGTTPEAQLQAFRTAVLAKSKIALDTAKQTAFYTDRHGIKLERVFRGRSKIADTVVNYHKWPMIENPWMYQPKNGNLTITDGIRKRVYDFKTWTIDSSTIPVGLQPSTPLLGSPRLEHVGNFLLVHNFDGNALTLDFLDLHGRLLSRQNLGDQAVTSIGLEKLGQGVRFARLTDRVTGNVIANQRIVGY